MTQIRIVRAPRVKRVRGCIDLAYVWPDTPEVGRGFAISNVTARNVLVNGVLDLRLTSFGIVEVRRMNGRKAPVTTKLKSGDPNVRPRWNV